MSLNHPLPPDDFEQQLARAPRRSAPADWRAEILSHANAASHRPAAKTLAPARVPASFLLVFPLWLRELSPAWSALAALWIICLAVNHFTGDALTESPASRFASGRLAPEQLAAVRAQRQEMLQLAGLVEPEPAEPPRPRPPGPRSSLRTPHYG